MKIWIDLTNSPHINFFKPFIAKWKLDGHEIFITARDLSNTLPLIRQNNWDYVEVGGHAGKNRLKKIMYFPKRVWLLRKILKRNKPDIGISHSSFYSPIVCKLLKFPSIYLNDNEHAKGNYLAFRFASLNILPEFLFRTAQNKKWLQKYNVEFYSGIKEGIYLSQLYFSNTKGRPSGIKKVFIRLEPWNAEYYRGKSEFMDLIISELTNNYEVNILPRSNEQAIYFKKKKLNNLVIHESPLSLEEIANKTSLFIGAGGSMTRELAFLGIPTFSVYQGDLLEVDKYLIEIGMLKHSYKPNVHMIETFLKEYNKSEVNDLKKRGIDAFNLIDKRLNELVSKTSAQ